ncbi:hypothetical protein HAD_01595 [Hyphomonas adhaerens MHS-3]|uniref:Lipoprotein n=2 Tax=Hyphomonas adhaerens TaxID=81029 RepID=A0A069E342_9PROT|nr:hypothetical protein HAD_01595 [Hyphomonas adhaerens MHS-3]
MLKHLNFAVKLTIGATCLMLQACATATTTYNSSNSDALLIHWANKHEMVFVPVNLQSGQVIGNSKLVLKDRVSAPRLYFKGSKEDKATARVMLDNGWDGRDTIDYATATVKPGTYALVFSGYWFDPGTGYMGISSAHMVNSYCFTDRAAVFEFKAGTINTLENWAHLKQRVESDSGQKNKLTEQNDELIRLLLKGYPDLEGEVKSSPIIALIEFDQSVPRESNGCYGSNSFHILRLPPATEVATTH